MTTMKTFFAPLFVLAVIGVLLAGCVSSGDSPSGTVSAPPQHYLRNNIHVQVHENGDMRASYANWINPGAGHMVIPVNTPVEIGKIRRGIPIIIKSTGKIIDFEFDEKNMAMTAEQYVNFITTTEPVALRNLSDIDRKGIADGKAYKGMSKEGVRIALGYPAAHRTPSLAVNTWVYWRNRFATTAIDFDGNGKVKGIR